MGQGSPDTWVHTETGIRDVNGDLVCDAEDPSDCTHLECNVGKPKVIVVMDGPMQHAQQTLLVISQLAGRWHTAQLQQVGRGLFGDRFTSGRMDGYEQAIALLLGVPVRAVRASLHRGEL